ncbi:MAG: hypothetical protein KJN90_14005 [Gammaproteobacteria bacterium]|nr:hypothetical protein [Gammaproteobacteria bacterium]
MNHLAAEISAWYQDVATGVVFEVVAIDEDSGTIEYQHVDGEVGEFELSTWQQLPLLRAEAPEDWRSPFEITKEDSIYFDQAMVPENWSGPLTEVEPELLDLGDDFQLL